MITVQEASPGFCLSAGLGETQLAARGLPLELAINGSGANKPALLGKQGLAPALGSETVLAPLQSAWPCFALMNQAIRGEPGLGDV